MSNDTMFFIRQFSKLNSQQLEETLIGFLSESKRLTHKNFNAQIEAITYLQDLQNLQIA